MIDHAEEVRHNRRQVEICRGCTRYVSLMKDQAIRCMYDHRFWSPEQFEKQMRPKDCNRIMEYLVLTQPEIKP